MNAATGVDVASRRKRLGWTSVLETLSFFALLGAMLAESEVGVSVIGATHGLLFLAYAFFVWVDHDELGWRTPFALLCVLTGPVGAVVALERLRRDRRPAATPVA